MRPATSQRFGVREQIYSNLIGQHVTAEPFATVHRLQDYPGAVAGRWGGQTDATARATALLAHAVQSQANVPAYIDGFMVIGFATIGVLLLTLLLRKPPGLPTPASV